MNMISWDIDLSDTTPLSEEEFNELLARAQYGDDDARERLIKSNLRLVMSIALRFKGLGYEVEDLFQIGSIGLIKAINRFDLLYDVKFSTYAVPLIIGEIRQFLRDSGPIKVSRSIKELAKKITQTRHELSTSMGREVSVSEIAEKMNLPKEEIIEALEATRPVSSLDEPIYTADNGEPMYAIDGIVAKDSFSEEKFALDEVIKMLPERERKIINLRFFHEKTQAEVATLTGLSQAQISRIEKNALKVMRERLA
mgnify:CR=1 FL=1